LRFSVDSGESAFLYTFCDAFARNQSLPSAMPPMHAYPGVFAARAIRTNEFMQRVSAFQVLANGPRELFLAAAKTHPKCDASTLFCDVDSISAYGIVSVASCAHFQMGDIAVNLVAKRRCTALADLIRLRPEVIGDAAREAWKSECTSLPCQFLRQITLNRRSACEAAVACASRGHVAYLASILRLYEFNEWEALRLFSIAATCKPPSAAAVMVSIICSSTEQSAESVITIAAAAGNAGAALIAMSDYLQNETPANKNAMLHAAALRAAYNYFSDAALLLAPCHPHNSLIITYIVRCDCTEYKWCPPRKHISSSPQCMWPLINATPKQLLASLYAVGHRIRGAHRFLHQTKFENPYTAIAAQQILSGVQASDDQLMVAASMGMTRRAVENVFRGNTRSVRVAAILRRQMKGNVSKQLQEAVLMTSLCFKRVADVYMPYHLCVTVAIMIL